MEDAARRRKGPRLHPALVGVLVALVCLISALLAGQAQAGTILSLIKEGPNQASDEDREYLIDRVRNVDSAGNLLPAGSAPTVGQIDVGDSFRGSINITTFNDSSANAGGITGNNELSGVFQLLVTNKVNLGTAATPLWRFTLAPDPAFKDPNTGAVAILVLYEDPSCDYAGDFDAPAPAKPPPGPDDGAAPQTVPPSSADVSVGPYETEEAFIATATNGTWFATLGFLGLPGEGGVALQDPGAPDNILQAFGYTSGSSFANANLGLNLIALGPAAEGLRIKRVTASVFGGVVDFAASQQTRGVHDLDTPFEVSTNLNVSFNATFAEPGLTIDKTCTDVVDPGQPIPFQAVLTNTGNETLINITCADAPPAPLSGVPSSLDPGASATVTGSYFATTSPSTDTITCSGTGQTSGVTVTASDSATCTMLVTGGCRMTGGHVKFYDDGTSGTVPGDAETYTVKQVAVKRGNKLVSEDQVTWYTLGGQIGAPQAECLQTPDTAFGNWEHNHHQGSVSWNGNAFSGGFAFHSGTASAPDEAYIKCILCADPGWCVQARCAPFKQIFWEGTGVFHSIDAGTTFPGCEPKTAGKNKPPTIHYYRAHVADFGEPAGSTQQQKPADQCDWTSAGVSISNGVLVDGVTVLPWPLDSKFGDKGGQDCSVDPPSGECPDWYEIEIHCTADPASPVIYKVGNFITHGNHQIHPEVGQQCLL